MEVIQQIGAYAGLAAVVGLAVLSALYFSQARDLKRLREWAARVPDRPEPARATARSRSSDKLSERPATAAADGGGGGATAPGSPGPAPTGGQQAATALSPAPAAQGSAPAAQSSAPAARTNGPPGAAVTAPAAATALARGSTPRRSPGGGPAPSPERPMSLRYVALAVVGALIVVGAGTFAVGLIGGREEPAPPERADTAGQSPDQGSAAAGDPSSVTFSVLNGTGVDGLAKQVADELEAAGYRRGNVTNASAQKAESTVLYAQGARQDALAVARELDVSQTEPIDAQSQELAGDASVVVVVGADETQ